MVLALAAFGLHSSYEMRGVRAGVRYLLVRCEIDMGFYNPKNRNKDLPEALYTDNELEYPTKGRFLNGTYTTTIIVTALGLIVLICRVAK